MDDDVRIYKNFLNDSNTLEKISIAEFPTNTVGTFKIGDSVWMSFGDYQGWGPPMGTDVKMESTTILDDYIKENFNGDFYTFLKTKMYDDYNDAETYNISAFREFANILTDAFNQCIDEINKKYEVDISYVLAYIDIDEATGSPYFAFGGINGESIAFGSCAPVTEEAIGHGFLHMSGTTDIADKKREMYYQFNIQSGANSTQAQLYNIRSMKAEYLGIRGADVSTGKLSEVTIQKCDKAISIVSNSRSECGAALNRLEHQQANAENASENIQASESLIRDANIAYEIMELAKFKILSQVSQAMLAQANSLPQGMLKLLND